MSEEPVELPIDGVLDLHVFNPKEIKELIPDYIELCREKGIFHIRLIHGKGTGTLRRLVHSILEKHPNVTGFYPGIGTGNWGATSVDLKPMPVLEKGNIDRQNQAP
jgi:DNA-nicking Smr family endonuclease